MKHLIFALLLCSCFQVVAQPVVKQVKGYPITVTDWGSRSIYILSDQFFAQTRDSIIAQIGQEEFDIMKDKCSKKGWPDGFYHSDLSVEEDKKFDSLLNTLKMYKIASYTHIYNGKTFDRYVVIRVPYEENRDWNKNLSWEGNIYFLLKEKDTRLL